MIFTNLQASHTERLIVTKFRISNVEKGESSVTRILETSSTLGPRHVPNNTIRYDTIQDTRYFSPIIEFLPLFVSWDFTWQPCSVVLELSLTRIKDISDSVSLIFR